MVLATWMGMVLIMAMVKGVIMVTTGISGLIAVVPDTVPEHCPCVNSLNSPGNLVK